MLVHHTDVRKDYHFRVDRKFDLVCALNMVLVQVELVASDTVLAQAKKIALYMDFVRAEVVVLDIDLVQVLESSTVLAREKFLASDEVAVLDKVSAVACTSGYFDDLHCNYRLLHANRAYR